jgi:hypothetical protein
VEAKSAVRLDRKRRACIDPGGKLMLHTTGTEAAGGDGSLVGRGGMAREELNNELAERLHPKEGCLQGGVGRVGGFLKYAEAMRWRFYVHQPRNCSKFRYLGSKIILKLPIELAISIPNEESPSVTLSPLHCVT